ncbi:hypothetical protein D3C83_34530 [compost metagenome]
MRVAPASMAAMLLMVPMSRSRWPCQSMPIAAPVASTIEQAKRTTARAPSGVACPTVSAMQIREAPAWMAVVNSRESVSGSDRVVSSVTYITVRPC